MADITRGLKLLRTPGMTAATRAEARTKPTKGSKTQQRKANRDEHRKGPHSKTAAKR